MKRSSWLPVALPVVLLVAGCAGSSGAADPPATPQALTSGAPASTTTDPPPVLGPTGMGRLQLGMSKGDALVSGDLAAVSGSSDAAGSGCAPYRLSKFPAAEEYQVGVSGTRGIELIHAPAGVPTPEGVAIGTPLRDARDAYPKLSGGGGVFTTPVPGQPNFVYRVASPGGQAVESLALMLRDQACV